MKSNILIHITKETEIQEKKIILHEYITDLFTYTTTPKLNLLFRKDTNKLYSVNEEEKELMEFKVNEQQLNQINQLKTMISSIDIKESEIEGKKKFTIEGKGDAIILNGEVVTTKVKGLGETVNHLAFQNAQQSSLFEINLGVDELIENSLVIMNIQGQEVQTKSTITDILVKEDNINEFDHIYNFQIN